MSVELATDVLLDGHLIREAGEELSPLTVWQLKQRYGSRINLQFRCTHCHQPISIRNADRSADDWGKRPHYYCRRKQDHTLPCVFAAGSDVARPGQHETTVQDKPLLPTRIIRYRPRRAGRTPSSVHDPDHPSVGQDPAARVEAHTDYDIRTVCEEYLLLGQGGALLTREEWNQQSLGLPGRRTPLRYEEAFVRVHDSPVEGYRLFHGPVRQVVQCRDGLLVSFLRPPAPLPTWQPTLLHIPGWLLNEVGGHEIRLAFQDAQTLPSYVFVCGQQEERAGGLVLQLESPFWLHTTGQPREILFKVQDESCETVLPQFMASRWGTPPATGPAPDLTPLREEPNASPVPEPVAVERLETPVTLDVHHEDLKEEEAGGDETVDSAPERQMGALERLRTRLQVWWSRVKE